MSVNYIIREMTRDDIDIAIEWAATEGWNPGLHDADSFYGTDPKGFLIGELNNEPIATISAVKYGDTFGFIGFYIVKPEYRDKGYGIQIWNAAMEYLKGRNIGLDGVVDQQENYKKSGFKLAYRNIRYEGVGDKQPTCDFDTVNLSSLPFEMIDSYDRLLFPANRSKFIKLWINQSGCNALGIMHEGKLAGYGVIRMCRTGYKIGPLFANGSELAESLFLKLSASVPSLEPVYFDVPETNQEALAMAERYNMKVVFETARMYTAGNPDVPKEKIYGVTSFELG
ncbi:MAG: GNAT family N-acetyltransferase [Desulfobacterales bacterium]|nr:GNAT family N-acetyltransferase [Desulfobacterales bacterium]MCP4162205.1 GNAT family N-acetyltransferase [Deltaproteobacteria bacterium]